jgi:hypothetical protein
MADYIDLMGFARGATLANAENWKDAFNQIKMDGLQTEAARSQELYDLKMPELRDSTAARMEVTQANREAAKLEAMIGVEATGIAPEGIGGLWAARLNEGLKSAGTDYLKANAIKALGARKLATLVTAGDLQGARALSMALGGEYTQKIESIETWRNPKNFSNPDAIAKAGGILRPDGKIEIDGVPGVAYDPEKFATMQLRRATSAVYDATKFMSEARNRQEKEGLAQKGVDDFNLRAEKGKIPLRAVLGASGEVQYVPVQATAADGSSTAAVPALSPVSPEGVGASLRRLDAGMAPAPALAPLQPQAPARAVDNSIAVAEAFRQANGLSTAVAPGVFDIGKFMSQFAPVAEGGRTPPALPTLPAGSSSAEAMTLARRYLQAQGKGPSEAEVMQLAVRLARGQ